MCKYMQDGVLERMPAYFWCHIVPILCRIAFIILTYDPVAFCLSFTGSLRILYYMRRRDKIAFGLISTAMQF